jgi:hypothetical protein
LFSCTLWSSSSFGQIQPADIRSYIYQRKKLISNKKKGLEKKNISIEVWNDTKIKPSERWKEQIFVFLFYWIEQPVLVSG